MTPSSRAQLYDRLPVTEDVAWWCGLAAASVDGRVLELGAGTGRLTLPLCDHADVTAVDHDPGALARLRDRAAVAGRDVAVHDSDVAALALGERYGVVLLPVSLLNELPDRAARRACLRAVADHTHRSGLAAFQLLNPFWLLAGGDSAGTIEGVDGTRVGLRAAHETVDLASQRARARLRYRFDDGQVLDDELDAAAVFPVELELALEAVGMTVTGWYGTVPEGTPLSLHDGAWYAVARFR